MRIDFQDEFPFMLNLSSPNSAPVPIIPVTLVGRRGLSFATYALLDSGADITLFHSNFAKRIGLDLFNGRRTYVTGIDGVQCDCYLHRIDLIIGSSKVRCDVGFADAIGQDVTDQLIGREVVFNRIRFGLRQKLLKTYGSPETR